MHSFPALIQSLPTPALADEVAAAIVSYESKLLTAAQATSGLADMKRLVAACEPITETDAITMLTSLARFVADVAGDDVDLDRLLVEWRIAQWQRRCADDGMPEGTRSNHLQRLRRMLRVRIGLPARIQVRGVHPEEVAALTEAERSRIEAALKGVEGGGAYVAACGAGIIGKTAEGATFSLIGDIVHIAAGTSTCRVLSPLQAFARQLVGHRVGRGEWARLRAVGARVGVPVSDETTRATHAILAIEEPATMVELIRDFGVTRRQIDRAIKMRNRVTSVDEMRTYLRG